MISPYDWPVSTTRRSGSAKPPPRYDRTLAMAIWIVTGLMFGFAVGIFTDAGWLWLGIGLVAGVTAAVLRTRPPQQVEED